ncbi:hypothetical protein [Streptomyces coeruleorubidus]|uniref:Uncharacterized protein n=1 Tax=Streptomyces coeruleorubidus TaxID=116188 RepID=A0A5J6IFL0_STRC4|nr:hypothetical protein [Streptomyces coeruleorubidus]QEV30004.1 hypothetical protein CP976_41940 [Streptomyces coeruleorubidus]GGT84421.1 hypothetical protein GCM10010256_50730 [Streptomyces coeruleorubidus]
MNRILGIELRRSAALGAALLIAVAGTIVLHATAGRWSTGWMALAMTQREYLAVLSPLAMAAGAWQSYREHRANVAELLAAVPRPRPQRMVPILATTALAVLVAYLVTLLAAAPRIADTARYLPPAAFVVVAVGLVAMIASVWLGLAVGRLVPALATAPALAVIGFALLILAPHALPDGGFTAAFSPAMGMSMFSDYDTVDGGVSAAQALWMAAVAVAGVVLFAVQDRKFAFAALLPLAIGATATALVVPTGDAYDQGTLDPVAQELVCTDDTPRVCVSRAHEGLLPEVTPKARHALELLTKTSIVEAHEDTSTFSPPTSPRSRADTALMSITVDKHGHLANPGRLEPTMLTGVFTSPLSCGDNRNFTVATAAAYWLLDREPTAGPDGLEFHDPDAVKLWKGLQALSGAEAEARVIAVYQAAQKCQDTTDLLSRGAR